jgi:hypothetical protein
MDFDTLFRMIIVLIALLSLFCFTGLVLICRKCFLFCFVVEPSGSAPASAPETESAPESDVESAYVTGTKTYK